MSHREPRTSATARRFLGALLVLALAGVATGCSEDSSDNSTASTSGQTTTTADAHARAVKFAECMRTNGYADFPDPDASGEFEGFGISVTPEVWVAALEACKDLQPPGSFSADLSPEELSAARRFAQCIRDNGVTDFPDPVSGEPIVDTTKIPSTDTEAGMAILNAAMDTCGELAEEAINEGSQP